MNLEEVLQLEELGLSLNKSAYLLNVSPSTLLRFTRKHGISWRGLGANRRLRNVEKNSLYQQGVAAGLSHREIAHLYWVRRMHYLKNKPEPLVLFSVTKKEEENHECN